MTLKELKTKIAEFANNEWYLNYQILMNFPHINYKVTLQGVPALYEFILKQIDGFEKYDHLPQEFVAIKKRFNDAKNTILNLLTNNNNANDQSWNSNLTFLTNNSPLVFLFDSPETDFLIKVSKENPNQYGGAYEYISGVINNIHNKNYLIGYLMAYEFTSKDFSLIAERKESEKKSISSTRADFQQKLGEAETDMTEYLTKANQKFVEYSGKIDDLKNEKDTGYNIWFEKISIDFAKFHTDSNKQITDLEDLYKAKLKLEAPAKYWSDRAKKLRKEGYWWLSALMACIGVGVCVLIWVLNRLSDGAYGNIFSETAIAIKWSIALITLISFLAFGIRTFSKLTFSSFHLVRDAEEREQLTYVYLALQKEKGIDQTERHLIMQSLFSRADSGLLKDDASPTMPGNIVDQMTKK